MLRVISKIIVLFIVVLFHSPMSFGNANLFFLNENSISNLKEDTNPAIPILKNGVAYRILKVENLEGNLIKSITISNSSVEIFHLPIINGLANKEILDVIIPYTPNFSIKQGKQYFLLKFHGYVSGSHPVKVEIVTNRKKYGSMFTMSVSNQISRATLDLNVWAYLDYNYLMKGVKGQVLNDLYVHKVSTFIIPPYVLPEVNNIKQEKLIQLSNYLKNSAGKFKQYIIYFGGWSDRNDNIMSPSWQKQFPVWVNSISKIFEQNNISFKDVIFYPYDEPRGQSISKLQSLITYAKSVNISNRFFVTVSEASAEVLSKDIDFVQVHSDIKGIVNGVMSSKSRYTKVWIYETNFGRSNSNKPKKYLDLAYKASKFNSTGIGLWSYADTKRENLTSFNKGVATWEMKLQNSRDSDNSLIYRKGNTIYSSLRWEALSFGIEEYSWLKLYGSRFGETKKNEIVERLISNDLQVNEWESIKLSLIK